MSYDKLFSNTAFIVVNRVLIKELGLDAAVLFGEIVSKADYFTENNLMPDDGYFFLTSDKIEENTGLSPYRQNKAIDILEKYGLVSTLIKGLPAKKFFKMCSEQALQFFKNLDGKNLRAKYLSNDNNNRINNNRVRRESSTPLSVEEVEEYVREKGYHFSAEEFVAYYDSQGWKKANGQKLTNWKSACVTWERKEREKLNTKTERRLSKAEEQRQKDHDSIERLRAMGIKFDEEE